MRYELHHELLVRSLHHPLPSDNHQMINPIKGGHTARIEFNDPATCFVNSVCNRLVVMGPHPFTAYLLDNNRLSCPIREQLGHGCMPWVILNDSTNVTAMKDGLVNWIRKEEKHLLRLP
jgi:hypothetical protein